MQHYSRSVFMSSVVALYITSCIRRISAVNTIQPAYAEVVNRNHRLGFKSPELRSLSYIPIIPNPTPAATPATRPMQGIAVGPAAFADVPITNPAVVPVAEQTLLLLCRLPQATLLKLEHILVAVAVAYVIPAVPWATVDVPATIVTPIPPPRPSRLLVQAA